MHAVVGSPSIVAAYAGALSLSFGLLPCRPIPVLGTRRDETHRLVDGTRVLRGARSSTVRARPHVHPAAVHGARRRRAGLRRAVSETEASGCATAGALFIDGANVQRQPMTGSYPSRRYLGPFVLRAELIVGSPRALRCVPVPQAASLQMRIACSPGAVFLVMRTLLVILSILSPTALERCIFAHSYRVSICSTHRPLHAFPSNRNS
ncbi:hypothetical protein B0H14DRAFT_1504440 [Mycena olivaceomarginata]|nr:hypothetical protein B0H14DRAFT_1504440 [Mycena olivaceomarginata]